MVRPCSSPTRGIYKLNSKKVQTGKQHILFTIKNKQSQTWREDNADFNSKQTTKHGFSTLPGGL